MRYIVGIDLGTTNSCVAYIDTQEPKLSVRSFKIPQLVAAGTVEALPALPSFCYLPAINEIPSASLRLPWSGQNEQNFIVGNLAKKQGAKVPTRLIQSAKSWLCHSAANRRERILPVEAADEAARISPVEATVRYLSHLRAAWNDGMAKGDEESEFDNQEIVLTVPASFDEVARNLTVEAAKKAGFLQMTLLEEPQAAFYSWIAEHEAVWECRLKSGAQIVVCDVGGGTSDFSLIEVVETDSKLSFRRMAVGDHLLLGGDNMDAALAHHVEAKFNEKGHELTNTQRQQLLHETRTAKEKLLSDSKEDHCRLVLYGEGSSVVKGTISADLYRDEVQDLLLKGFFGSYTWDEALKLKKTAGFRSMGLPYENEPSIIKHLAHFLFENGNEQGIPIKPDFILFNGGAMTPKLFRQAIISNINAWLAGLELEVLPSYNLDLAVARGAAYFGKARRGLGVKIGGGLARGYYLILDTKDQAGAIDKKALTLMPRGSEEGEVFEPSTTFMLTPNTPVSFQLATSHVRLHDKVGDLISINPEEMHFLPSINTVLRFGKKQGTDQTQEKIPVHLVIALTPIGTLEIGLKSLKTDHRWALEFQLKAATGQDNQIAATSKRNTDQTFDSGYLKDAEALINKVFSLEHGNIKLSQLNEKLEELLAMPRREWSPSVMRGLFDVVMKVASFRKITAEHTERWWNLAGFLLRPGFGYSLDDFRIKELWKVILADFKSQLTQELQIQMWICYRRVAGGLSKGQQMQVVSDLIATLFSKRTGIIEVGNKADSYLYSEKIRALASMELLEAATKVRLGNALVQRIQSGKGTPVDYWSLGRVGARHLIYGSLVHVVARDIVEGWIDKILDVPCKEEGNLVFLLEQLARKTEHRELNVSQPVIEKILSRFEGSMYEERLQELLLKESRLTKSEQDYIFGEQLPAGLLLEEA